MERKKVLLIIPAYNEEEIIINTARSVDLFRDSKQPEYELDYIVVNDGSTDNTRDLLRDHNIPYINHFINLGIGGAVQSGYRYARYHNYDVAVQFDGDGQHDIQCLDTIVRPILEGQSDFVVGSRFVKDSESEFRTSFMRRVGIRLISFAIYLSCGKKIYDTTSGYRAASKKVIRHLSHRYPVSYPEPESIVHIVQNGFRVEEIGVKMFSRETGESSISPLKSMAYMAEVLTTVLISGINRRGGRNG